MEHRVKQRSSEWFKLRKSVPLTASQFADAVGVGMGKPFHFFQSIVEAKTENAEEDGPASPKNENIEHGEKMETVIREAYELLTGKSFKMNVMLMGYKRNELNEAQFK